MDIENRICRICQEEGGNFFEDVCDCRGSLAHVHRKCLLKWIASKPGEKMTCEICKSRYNIQRTYFEKILEPLNLGEIFIPILFLSFFGFNFIISITCSLIFFVPDINVCFIWFTPMIYVLVMVVFCCTTLRLPTGQKMSVVLLCEIILSLPILIVLFLLGVFLHKNNFYDLNYVLQYF